MIGNSNCYGKVPIYLNDAAATSKQHFRLSFQTLSIPANSGDTNRRA